VKDDDSGEIKEIHCSYDPESRGGWTKDNRRVKGTLHWVSVPHAADAEVRLYEHLFTKENPFDIEEGKDFKDYLNPHSLQVLKHSKAEPGLTGSPPGKRFQFLRQGYFCVDPDTSGDHLVFNRTVSLRDTWAKIQKKTGA
ncbi:MAG: glutamine--tRNA ligase, partial [Candidatus Aminicenantaceae bacterium]